MLPVSGVSESAGSVSVCRKLSLLDLRLWPAASEPLPVMPPLLWYVMHYEFVSHPKLIADYQHQ